MTDELRPHPDRIMHPHPSEPCVRCIYYGPEACAVHGLDVIRPGEPLRPMFDARPPAPSAHLGLGEGLLIVLGAVAVVAVCVVVSLALLPLAAVALGGRLILERLGRG